MRNIQLIEDGLYHVINRAVDKRPIFLSRKDLDRFFNAMNEFNIDEPVGHLNRCLPEATTTKKKKLVEFVAYNLERNHFHFILKQKAERGIERLMHKLEMSHAKFFNLKYHRSGALFQGPFKAMPIDTNDYLLHVSAYVNLNDIAHARGKKPALSKSSWEEYIGKSDEEFCEKSIILDQFADKKAYKKFAESALKDIIDHKILLAELEDGFVSTLRVDSNI